MGFQNKLRVALRKFLESEGVFEADRVTDWYERTKPYEEDGFLMYNAVVEVYYRDSDNQLHFFEYDGAMVDLLDELQ